jgi:hypothetical protein
MLAAVCEQIIAHRPDSAEPYFNEGDPITEI